MKTLIPFKSIMITLFMLCVFQKVQAQSPLPASYPISNSGSCTFNISYELYDKNCSFLSSGSVNVPPSGASISTGGAYDIKITVLNSISPTCAITQNPTGAAANNVCPSSPTANLSTNCGCGVNSLNVTVSGATIN